MLLNPCESTATNFDLDTLGYRVNTDPTTVLWTGRTLFCKYTPYPTGYEKWTFEVIRKSFDTLKWVGILGAVAVSTGSYNFDSSMVKGLIEMWCPKTNSFITPFSKVGISLWDLRCIGGLPIIGELYEEYVPPNSELYSMDNYPTTLRDLLNVYQWIYYYASGKTNKVNYFERTKFFFRDSYGRKKLKLIPFLMFYISANLLPFYPYGCAASSCHTKHVTPRRSVRHGTTAALIQVG